MNESEDKKCNLCCEQLQAGELNFYPCPCGYQICLFCYQKMMEKYGTCPQCRQPFPSDAKSRVGSQYSPQNNKIIPTDFFISKKMLQVVGLPANLLDKNKLLREEYFGQYGEIKQLKVFNDQPQFEYNSFPNSSGSVYVRFKRESDALNCYYALDGFSTSIYALHVSFAITEQCSSFLQNGTKCGLSDCLKMHRNPKPGELILKNKDFEKQSKKYLSAIKVDIPDHYFQYPSRCSGRSVFPPPRMFQPNFNFQLFDIYSEFNKPYQNGSQLQTLSDVLHI